MSLPVRTFSPPIRVGIIGLGGFAGAHHRALLRLEETGEAQLVCTCDPRVDQFRAQLVEWRCAERGVEVFDDFRTMLAAARDRLDLVVIPTPIPLHAPMHRATVEAGLAVYLEKPPTLDHAELEAMIHVDRGAVRATAVGFNFIYEPVRRALKRRLVDGEFGALRRLTFHAAWPRPESYFRRAAWAGRLVLEGRPVLDSCLGNACAHYVHNVFFWAGTDGLDRWCSPAWVEAALFRAHAIEGTDTVFVRGETELGTSFRLALTHACEGEHVHDEAVECEHATLHYRTHRRALVAWHDGRREEFPLPQDDHLAANHRACYRYLTGEADRPPTMLADCRAFVRVNALAYVAAGRITTLPVARVPRGPDDAWRPLPGWEEARDTFLATGRFPTWSVDDPGTATRRATPADLPRLPGVLAAMVREAQGAAGEPH
jgi:predicted dehydrogenase